MTLKSSMHLHVVCSGFQTSDSAFRPDYSPRTCQRYSILISSSVGSWLRLCFADSFISYKSRAREEKSLNTLPSFTSIQRSPVIVNVAKCTSTQRRLRHTLLPTVLYIGTLFKYCMFKSLHNCCNPFHCQVKSNTEARHKTRIFF